MRSRITDPQSVVVTVLDNVILTKLVCYHNSHRHHTIMRSEPMYDFDDTVTAVTFRINGLSTQDVLLHIHNIFSDKIAAAAKNIPELGEGEKWDIKQEQLHPHP
eukprot:g1830.t1